MGLNYEQVRPTAFAVLASLLIAACASNEKIASFAQSGIAYTEEVPKAYDYAFAQAVDRNSADLIKQRERLPANRLSGDRLKQAYGENNEALKRRLDYLGVMKRHLTTLQDYFIVLYALASGSASAAAGEAADGLAGQLAELSPKVKDISIGDKVLRDFVGPIASLTVGAFVNARLQEHLAAHADTVREGIALQEAMFGLLLEIESDRQEIKVDHQVAKELADLRRDLPADWKERRRQVLAFQLAPGPISAAEEASRQLGSNFDQLVQGGQGTLSSLERAIAYLDTVVRLYEANKLGGEQ